MSNEFKKAVKMIKEMERWLFKGYSSLLIWKKLDELISFADSWEKAKANVDVINAYRYFFLFTKQSHIETSILHATKFFDMDNRSISIVTLLRYIEENYGQFETDDFANFFPKRELLKKILSSYEPITAQEINNCKNLLKSNGFDIDQADPVHRFAASSNLHTLKEYRNKVLIHTNYAKQGTVLGLSRKSLEDIYDLAGEIMNIISWKLLRNTFKYRVGDQERHTGLVVEYLARFEPYRLQEITEESNRKLVELKSWRIDNDKN